MKVAVIGQGYVGLTISVFAAQANEIVGYDRNAALVKSLNNGKSHIEGVDGELLKLLVSQGKFKATASPADIIGSDIVLIAVPTPLDLNRKPDLSFIGSACKVIAENLRGPALIINESTSYPGTLRNFIKPTIEKYSTKIVER